MKKKKVKNSVPLFAVTKRCLPWAHKKVLGNGYVYCGKCGKFLG